MSGMSIGQDIQRIACNYTNDTSAVSKGSIAYVMGGNYGNGYERLDVLARSRGGRFIRRWEPITNLGNFRMKTIPASSSLYGRLLDGCGSVDTLQGLRLKVRSEA